MKRFFSSKVISFIYYRVISHLACALSLRVFIDSFGDLRLYPIGDKALSFVRKRRAAAMPRLKTCYEKQKRMIMLFPLCAVCFLLCSLILPGLQSPEHGNPLRYAAAQCWDSTGTKIETQTQLGQPEFRFLSQWETRRERRD